MVVGPVVLVVEAKWQAQQVWPLLPYCWEHAEGVATRVSLLGRLGKDKGGGEPAVIHRNSNRGELAVIHRDSNCDNSSYKF
jgi:hypothetical protein